MRQILIAAFALSALSAPALAQVPTYPSTVAGARADGTVPLQCDASETNCAPVKAANPLQVTIAGGSSVPTGTAGAPNAAVVSVQGVSGGTVIPNNQTQVNGVAVATGNGGVSTGVQRVSIASDNTAFIVNATTAGTTATSAPATENPNLSGCAYGPTLPSIVATDKMPLVCDSLGRLRAIAGTAAAQSDDITNQAVYLGGNDAQDGVLINNSLLFDGTNLDRSRSIANATNSVGTGIAAVGLVAQLDDTSPTAITENQVGNVRMNAARALNTTQKPDTTGGVTPARVVTGTTGTIKAGAGQLYTCVLYNSNAAVRHFQFYNKATAPTLSTDTPVVTVTLLGASSRDVDLSSSLGVAFSTGIAWAYTTDNVAIPTTAGTSTEGQFTCTYM